MEAFSERLLRINPAAGMQQHPFVTDIEQDRLPTVVFRIWCLRALVATAPRFLPWVSKAPGIQQRWLIGVLNAPLIYRSRGLNRCCQRGRSIAEYPDDLPGVRRFRDGMRGPPARAAMSRIVTLMFGAEWMYSCWCRRASEHRQRDADLRRWVEMHAETNFISRRSA